ncbi:AbrB family transcriptional regulator [Rhodobacteraceae bacterium RKSG542]|uniref:AbrB family transcriptional regulator n=1 Tax=Pseudovibrio flavus TaxID=2529854 RepID=UPI0012BC0174|nr:AbrB family transcriptional regulator [Pseudovibrio flavus]MTI18834.1 AbrB family transcriptional regulator [Pseudovibrio flavus]
MLQKLNTDKRIKTVLATSLALLIGAAGAFLAQSVGLPAAMLSGSMVAVSVAALLRAPIAFPIIIRDICFVAIGIAMGQGVTPESLAGLSRWPISLTLIALVVVAITLSCFFFLKNVCGWKRDVSFFASVPGALGYVIALAEERRISISPIMTVQILRLLALVAIVPTLLTWGRDTNIEPQQVSTFSTPLEMIVLAGLCIVAGYIGHRIKLPAGLLTGAFIVSSLLNGSGLMTVNLPPIITDPFYIGLGVMIGYRFIEVPMENLLRWLRASVGSFFIGLAVSMFCAFSVATLLDLPFGQLFLAYAPGGMEVMTLLAFMLDMDPAFVATHQLVRYIGMVVCMPLAAKLILGSSRGQ